MQIQVLKSKIHQSNRSRFKLYWQYYYWWKPVRSPNILKVKVSVNINNGERFETYAKGARNSGEITLNGPAARKVQKMILSLLFLTPP
jgi:aspartate 1-decarboxylase